MRKILSILAAAIGGSMGLMMQVGPHDAAANFCSWLSIWHDCTQSLPPWFDVWGWLLPVSLIASGFIGLFIWPFTSGASRARLAVSGPHLFRDERYVNNRQYRMKVHNIGPSTATNVQMKLRGMPSPPRSSAWQADYPYPIIQVGLTLDTNDCRINKDDDAVFETVFAWANEAKTLFVGLDTKRPGHPITIEKDERWELNYVVTAENADQVKFTLEVYVEDNAVVASRKN